MRVSRRSASVAALWLTATLGGTAHAAVADYIGRRITSVRLVLEGHETTDPALMQVVETQVGRPLSMAEVRETITHLFSLGRFDDVRADATLERGSVVLRYELTPIHPVVKIDFAGDLKAPGVDEGRLRRAVVDRFGASPPLGRAAEAARLVADSLQERGYLRPTVTPRADIEHAPDRAVLVLTIDPGPRTTIGTVDVVGVPAAQRAALVAKLRVSPGAPYERDALTARIARYIEERRKHGYYEAKVVPTVALTDAGRVANLTVNVAPGPHMRVVFAGDPLPADQRGELVPVEREGSADEDLLEDSSNRIEEYLKGLGYRDAVAPHVREIANGELLITFTVKKGRLYRVDRVVLSGNTSIPLADIEPLLRLRDGQPFSDARLDADISSIEDVYHRRGFASAKAPASLDLQPVVNGEAGVIVPVVVTIAVTEGIRTVIGSIQFGGNQAIPEATLREGLALEPGGPYSDEQLAAARDATQSKYANLGYQTATVGVAPNYSADGSRADPVFTIHEGPRIFVDHILIVGNVRTSASTIEHELQIKPGDPLGVAAVNESQRRLAALGLFRRTRITELRHGSESARDLLVTVEEAPPTTIGGGAGGQVWLRTVRLADNGGVDQRLEFAPRASFQIGRRNLFGKNRSANLFTSFSLHLKNASSSTNDVTASSDGGYGFPEYRILGTFREPRVFDTTADLVITGTLEQQIRSSFNFSRRGAGVQIARHLTRGVSVTGNYQIQRTKVFDVAFDLNDKQGDRLLIDRAFPQVRLSSFSTSVIDDTRDDPVNPRMGRYVSANGQLAGRSIGSEIGFVKSFFTAQMFRTLPHTNRIVFAGNARLGLATGFQREVVRTDANGQPVPGPDGQPIVDLVKDLPASERFFAGGDTTVRGFALDSLGSAGTIKEGFPIGGNSLVILNAELRMPVWGAVGAVAFVDAGNVFPHARDIDLTALRGAIGGGVRVNSPVGPIRFDIGFKLRREEIVPGRREGLTAVHISFGQAF
jgi:outer membrane protein assembly complex protein YaeT